MFNNGPANAAYGLGNERSAFLTDAPMSWERYRLSVRKRLDRIISQHKEKIQEDSFSKDFILYVSDLIRYEKFYDADNEMDYLEDHLENKFVKERKRALEEV